MSTSTSFSNIPSPSSPVSDPEVERVNSGRGAICQTTHRVLGFAEQFRPSTEQSGFTLCQAAVSWLQVCTDPGLGSPDHSKQTSDHTLLAFQRVQFGYEAQKLWYDARNKWLERHDVKSEGLIDGNQHSPVHVGQPRQCLPLCTSAGQRQQSTEPPSPCSTSDPARGGEESPRSVHYSQGRSRLVSTSR